MSPIELLDIISSGETSRVQFKEKIDSPDGLAAEMIAMSNSRGGIILVGVKDKTGEPVGVSSDELKKYNSSTPLNISNIATSKVIPNVFIMTEIIPLDNNGNTKKILVIEIKEGVNKPYKDKNSIVWTKQGADKRKVTDNNELLRLFQESGNLLADEMEVPNTSIEDIDLDKLKQYTLKALDKSFEATGLSINRLAENINVIRNQRLTLGGLLFFGKNPQKVKPVFCIKAVSFFGNDSSGSDYRGSKDIIGTIPNIFEEGMAFLNSYLRHTQQGQNFNSTGILEISNIALEEILQNALIHRNYFKNSPIRIMIFDNRVEIISPGALPNSLTVDNIKAGNAVVRNNLLASYCAKVMPYRGFGTGVKRAMKEQPNSKFINDATGEQFIVKIPRPDIDN
ncbi:putative DNA binding domain-containing protein [bacterium]|nr:putative DNA binding domain-containing protein [bacterium]